MTGSFSGLINEVEVSPISTTLPSIDPAYNGKSFSYRESATIFIEQTYNYKAIKDKYLASQRCEFYDCLQTQASFRETR